MDIDHLLPNVSGQVERFTHVLLLDRGQCAVALESHKVVFQQLQILAGHEGIEGRNNVFGQLPVLGIDRPGDVRQTQIACLLVFVLASIDCIGKAVCRLACHITWEAVLCCHLDGFVVAEVQHFDRGIVLGVTNERCRFSGAGKCLDQ
ncbi:hypothetical protein ALO53_200028 [Pseudomonas amygdali pv. photiniae]|uniref:Putative exclusion-determining protein n=1 Tax=Pseudomonas amygdali pv. photiniae TaxID=251724 RepID=A0A0P9TY57_PSEA0|nr:hypothetical protein ALO53_200028 [Pseudomonas amygdali pv. photiniae]